MIYQPGKFLRLFYEGLGNIYYDGLVSPSASGLTGANNGLSKVGANAVLGQNVGTVGNPAALLSDREIPDAGHTIFVGLNNGVAPNIGLSAQNGISVSNNNGTWFQTQGSGTSFLIGFDTGGTEQIFFNFGGGADLFTYHPQGIGGVVVSFLQWFGSIITGGFGGNIQPTSGGGSFTASPDVFTYLIDATAGVTTVLLNNANYTAGQIFNFKKTDASANGIVLTPSAGTIQGLGAPAATVTFSTQGETLTVQFDGTNYFVI
jgi:hypothetical protein